METGLEAEILLRIILQEDTTRVVLRQTFVGGMRLMVSSLVSMIERSGIDPWPGCVLGHDTLSVSLHPGLQMGSGELHDCSNSAIDSHLIQRGRGDSKTPSRFMLQKPG